MKITEDQAQRLFEAVDKSMQVLPYYTHKKSALAPIFEIMNEILSSQPKEEIWFCDEHWCLANTLIPSKLSFVCPYRSESKPCKISKYRKVEE